MKKKENERRFNVSWLLEDPELKSAGIDQVNGNTDIEGLKTIIREYFSGDFEDLSRYESELKYLMGLIYGVLDLCQALRKDTVDEQYEQGFIDALTAYKEIIWGAIDRKKRHLEESKNVTQL